MKICVLIVAAGKGLRAGGGDIPKQYQLIGGSNVQFTHSGFSRANCDNTGLPVGAKTVLTHTIEAFLSIPSVSLPSVEHIIVAINPDHENHYNQSIYEFIETGKILPWVAGGSTRQETVANGLKELANTGATHVLIHDAARPFVSKALIRRIIKALYKNNVVLPAMPVTDTLKYVENNLVSHTVDRSPLWAAQTPQAFDLELILRLHQKARDEGKTDFTDDIALAEWQSHPVTIVEGESSNTKITTAQDLVLADMIMKMRKTDK